MKKSLLLLLASPVLAGCFITNSPGFYSGYKKLDADERQSVVVTGAASPVCSIENDRRIYAINGAQLLTCLKDNDTSVVYFWSPNCHSDVCISTSAAQYYCDKRKYKLYVVAEYYDLPKMKQQNTNAAPMYSINSRFYGTDYCNKYTARFAKELAGRTRLSKNDLFNRFFFFKGDQLVHTASYIDQRDKKGGMDTTSR